MTTKTKAALEVASAIMALALAAATFVGLSWAYLWIAGHLSDWLGLHRAWLGAVVPLIALLLAFTAAIRADNRRHAEAVADWERWFDNLTPAERIAVAVEMAKRRRL